MDPNWNPPPPPHAGYAPYPKLDPNDTVPVPNTWTPTPSAPPVAGAAPLDPNDAVPVPHTWISSPSAPPVADAAPIPGGYTAVTTMPAESNPYVSAHAVAPSPMKNKKVKDVLANWGKKAAETTKKAEGMAGDVWQHLKTGPSLADAAVGRITQSTKVLAEGGYEKVFQSTFGNVPGEKLLKSYGCYLSTSAGPIVGVLYLSTAKIAFCSDNPLSYKESEEVRWSHYKVIVPLNQLKAINPTTSKSNPAEKYVQIISFDNHEFWFMGFLNYDSAVKNLLNSVDLQSRPGVVSSMEGSAVNYCDNIYKHHV